MRNGIMHAATVQVAAKGYQCKINIQPLVRPRLSMQDQHLATS